MGSKQSSEPCQCHVATEATSGWNPNAVCGGTRAEERAQWLVSNSALTHQAATETVMMEFPAQFTAQMSSGWNPNAICGGTRAEERAQWLVANKAMAPEAAAQQVMTEFPAAFAPQASTQVSQSLPPAGWNPEAMCGDSRAEQRAAWLVTNQGMSQEVAMEKVMQEFPAQFKVQAASGWNSDAMCGDIRAEERVQWLMKNKAMSRQAAIAKVMDEFPRAFAENLASALGPSGHQVTSTHRSQPYTAVPVSEAFARKDAMAVPVSEAFARKDAVPESSWGSSMLAPIRADPPPFPAVEHPLKPLHLSNALSRKAVPTNKFIGNLLVGINNQPIWTHPYVLRPRCEAPFGLGMCCAPKQVSGASADNNRDKFYYNEIADDVGFGASEFATEPVREIVELDELCLSAEIRFTSGLDDKSSLSAPLVRGMAYVTFEYDSLTPVMFTKNAIQSVNGQALEANTQPTLIPAAERFQVELSNGQCWLIYSLNGTIQLSLTMRGHKNELVASEPFTGILRAALLPGCGRADVLDKHASVFPVGCALTVAPMGYTLTWKTKGGEANDLLHYTMLHHRAALRKGGAAPTDLVMRSTTKGPLVAYIGNTWCIDEPTLPTITWLPPKSPDAEKTAAIRAALTCDIFETFLAPEGLAAKFPDNYFAGKELYKFAMLALVADSLSEAAARDECVAKLKVAIAPFVAGAAQNPLRYDRTWGGLVGSRGLEGNVHADFGASYYNDHHYHWGYFIQTAAIIGHFDQAWALQNRLWVEALIRDVSNPSSGDPYFTPWRSFDWFSGHCWSQGLFESADGKDQESTSEEINYHYGVMLWGIAVGNVHLEQLGRLMTAVATRSIKTYFLMESDNEAHPPNFIRNKVTGVFFENKADYSTWFGQNPEYIHGIQMLPMTAISESVRSARFVAEEWPLLQEVAHSLTSGWKSVLLMNYAILDRDDAFQQLQHAPLDGGITRTWALFWAATRPNPSQS